MDITGKITGIKYTVCLKEDLKIINFNNFDINDSPTACVVEDNKNTFAVSKWVSPKRTRSYPYERIYNTLTISKKVTVIPIVKDEGETGDRDFIQWDTISLMSLLDVYVIFAYYHSAEKSGNKITNQKYDNGYVLKKLREIKQYHSSALHWNINELQSNLHSLLDIVTHSYSQIESLSKVKLHNKEGLERFKSKIGNDVSKFMEFSRLKSEKAQEREIVTIQPKESLSSYSKAKITITNYLGGKYFFTVDEVKLEGNNLFLIEGKHTVNSVLPSKGDIKDGLLKMILYTNLCEVKVNNEKFNSKPILDLTSIKLSGNINSESLESEKEKFFQDNNISELQKKFIKKLFEESIVNKFIVNIRQAK